VGEVVFRRGSEEFRVVVDEGLSLYEASVKAGIYVGSICGGRGFCGKCRVRVVSGELSSPTEVELRHLGTELLNEGYRLACQARPASPRVVVEVLTTELMKAAVMGYEPEVPLEPAVAAVRVRRALVTLDTPHRSTLESITVHLGRGAPLVNVGVLRKLASSMSKEVDVVVHRGVNEVIDVRPVGRGCYGIAIDVGTTKVAVYLVDLRDGSTIYADAFENPQDSYGADVISRIAYAMEHGVRDLRLALLSRLNSFLNGMYRAVGIGKEEVVDAVVVGNAVMHHAFLGLNLKGLGASPYEEVVRAPLDVKARDVGLGIHPEAYVHLPPLLGGFIGSDSLVGAFINGLGRREGTYLFLDIGTNTEVFISRDGDVIATSAASGPAFEGGHIRFGMKATEGAIDSVVIKDADEPPEYTVIGGGRPRGLCGSGLIDLLAELLRKGIVDPTGRLVAGSSRRVRGDGPLEYVVVDAGESGLEVAITLSQRDVRELQKAKAAIQTAIRILSRKLGVSPLEVDEVYVAGSFGLYIRPESAITIGLLPEVPVSRVKLVGNTAGSGARVLLKNAGLREELVKFRDRVRYVELALERDFQEVYVDSIYMPSGCADLYPNTFRSIKGLLKGVRFRRGASQAGFPSL